MTPTPFRAWRLLESVNSDGPDEGGVGQGVRSALRLDARVGAQRVKGYLDVYGERVRAIVMGAAAWRSIDAVVAGEREHGAAAESVQARWELSARTG